MMQAARKLCDLTLSLLVLAGCDAAVVGRLADDAGPPAPLCPSEPSNDAGIAVGTTLAYGGESAATTEFSEGRVNGGRQFEVTSDCLYVVELGVWDHRQDGLSRAHAVALFALDRSGPGATAEPVPGAAAEVQAGTGVPIEDGFRLAVLPRPVRLERGFYAVIAYDFSSEEPYGHGGSVPEPSRGVRDVGFSPLELAMDTSLEYPAEGDGEANVTASFRYLVTQP